MKPSDAASVMVSFRVTPEAAAELRELVDQLGVSRSQLLRDGVALVKRAKA
jgi:hypothetical protein